MTTYFISDIHLHAHSTTQSNLLLDFLRSKGPTADAIYILGDLFAIWLGDDLQPTYSQNLIMILQELTTHKIPVYFMRGNRDFLVGKQFCQASGCTLLNDPCKINLYGKDVLLTHGDLLCTLDHKYQCFRKLVQNPIVQKLFLCLPRNMRLKLGMWVKNKANRAQQNPIVYDVEEVTVNEWFNKFSVQLMIHGHTHQPAIHKFNNTTRIVLGDWNTQSAKILAVNAQSYSLEDLMRSAAVTN